MKVQMRLRPDKVRAVISTETLHPPTRTHAATNSNNWIKKFKVVVYYCIYLLRGFTSSRTKISTWQQRYWKAGLCPSHYQSLTSLVSDMASCSRAIGFLPQRFSEEWADWIWFSLGLHVFTVTSSPHLARFTGDNFPLWWPPYWRLGFSCRSRVTPGGQLSVHSALQSPSTPSIPTPPPRGWPAQTGLSCFSQSRTERHVLQLCWDKPLTELQGL